MSVKVVLFLALLSCTAFALPAVTKEELYPDKYDYIDFHTILDNPRQRVIYYKCMDDTGPCLTDDAKFVKSILAEAVVTKCRKCTEKQKEALDTVAAWYTENEPEKWNKLIEKMVQSFILKRQSVPKKSVNKKNE